VVAPGALTGVVASEPGADETLEDVVSSPAGTGAVDVGLLGTVAGAGDDAAGASSSLQPATTSRQETTSSSDGRRITGGRVSTSRSPTPWYGRTRVRLVPEKLGPRAPGDVFAMIGPA
jgi:hypothetical protein